MFRLRTGILLCSILIGIVLLSSFLSSLPDRKLHIFFCNVGQGDAAYILFPDGHDMVIDGGPDNKVLACLGRYMPFWDRKIDMVELTHPQKDHLNGLIEVVKRFEVGNYIHSEVSNTSDGYEELNRLLSLRHVTQKSVTTGQSVQVGPVTLSIIWPTRLQIGMMKPVVGQQVLGIETGVNLNDASVVMKLSYGTFDVLFTGDADERVDSSIVQLIPVDVDGLEVLKVPHHGSKTGMTESFLTTISPDREIAQRCKYDISSVDQKSIPPGCPIALISVGKNTYGHPDTGIIQKLASSGFQVLRTDKIGDVEVVSDGRTWTARTAR